MNCYICHELAEYESDDLTVMVHGKELKLRHNVFECSCGDPEKENTVQFYSAEQALSLAYMILREVPAALEHWNDPER